MCLVTGIYPGILLCHSSDAINISARSRDAANILNKENAVAEQNRLDESQVQYDKLMGIKRG